MVRWMWGRGAWRAIAFDRDQELVGALAGSSVQRTGHGGQAGQEGVVDVGPGRRRHPDGHGRGGQFVVGQQDECGVDRSNR